MTALLSLIGIGFVGTILWFINTEATSVVYRVQFGWHPVWIGVVLSLSQNVMYLFLYFGGDRIVRCWTWLGRKVEHVRTRYGQLLDRAYLPTTFVAAIFGIPPVLALVTLASSMGIRLRQLLPITLYGRFVRFFTLAIIGETIFAWWASL